MPGPFPVPEHAGAGRKRLQSKSCSPLLWGGLLLVMVTRLETTLCALSGGPALWDSFLTTSPKLFLPCLLCSMWCLKGLWWGNPGFVVPSHIANVRFLRQCFPGSHLFFQFPVRKKVHVVLWWSTKLSRQSMMIPQRSIFPELSSRAPKMTWH